MYVPAHFEEDRPEMLHALMRAHPLATIVTLTPAGLVANHIPLQFEVPARSGGPGVLRGHVARANPLWTDAAAGVEALAVFQGPQGYISPSWYPTKKEHGKVVPTWNYCCVHAHGTLRIHDDPAWVRLLVAGLTAAHEAQMPQPWSIDDAPADFIDASLRNIVGIEIVIERLQGKWKISQNQPQRNRAGVVQAMTGRGTPEAAVMAELITRHAPGDGPGKP